MLDIFRQGQVSLEGHKLGSFAFGLLTFGDIAGVDHNPTDARIIELIVADGFHITPLALAISGPKLNWNRILFGFHKARQRCENRLVIIGMNKFKHISTDDV